MKFFNIVFFGTLALVVMCGFVIPRLVSSNSYELPAAAVVLILVPLYFGLRFAVSKLTAFVKKETQQ